MRKYEWFGTPIRTLRLKKSWVDIELSFILAGILSRKFTFFYAPRKKLLHLGKTLKTHGTPTPALFMQKTPKKCPEKNFPRERNTHFLFPRERNTHFFP